MSARLALRSRPAMAFNRPTWTCVRPPFHASRYASPPPIPRPAPIFKPTIRPFSSSNNNRHQTSPDKTTNTPYRRRYPLLLLTLTTLTLTLYLTTRQPPTTPVLSPDAFTPFTITSLTPISPTSFLLTLTPRQPTPHPLLPFTPTPTPDATPLLRAWHHGLFSIEIKQPLLQVSRDYTPLPPLSPSDPTTLRFLIRRVNGGSVSTYLSTLPIGATVELRGPHLGFDVISRLGSEREVVLLAGGTGVAVAMQAVHALGRLPGEKRPRVDVVFGCREGREYEAVGRMLAGLRRGYGEGRMKWMGRVEEEGGGRIEVRDVMRATVGGGERWWWKGRARGGGARTGRCGYHDGGLTAGSAGSDPFWGEEEVPRCLCVDEDGAPVKGGRKLLMVSGPEGFVKEYVGGKVWGEGKELQGSVGGLVGRMKQAGLKGLGEWLVLKF